MQRPDERELHPVQDGTNALRPEQAASGKRTQTELQNLKHKLFGDLVPRSHPVGYDMRQYLGELGVLVDFKQSSNPPFTLPHDGHELRASSLGALLWSTSKPVEHQANLFFISGDVRFLREVVWTCRLVSTPKSEYRTAGTSLLSQ